MLTLIQHGNGWIHLNTGNAIVQSNPSQGVILHTNRPHDVILQLIVDRQVVVNFPRFIGDDQARGSCADEKQLPDGSYSSRSQPLNRLRHHEVHFRLLKRYVRRQVVNRRIMQQPEGISQPIAHRLLALCIERVAPIGDMIQF